MTNVQDYIPRRTLRKEKTLTETNVLYLRWLLSRHATDANVKVLLNEHENSNKDLAMDLNFCIHLQPLKLTSQVD